MGKALPGRGVCLAGMQGIKRHDCISFAAWLMTWPMMIQKTILLIFLPYARQFWMTYRMATGFILIYLI
jgi:hypothetical protein